MLGPIELVDEIDSTNAELLRRARAGADGGVVLVAQHQSAGRGRLDRRWEAGRGASLLVSVLLRPAVTVEELHLISIVAALAALDAVEEVAGVRLALKWPNDVVTGDDHAQKVAGLLAESILRGAEVEAVVVGMGLNVRETGALPSGGIALDALAGHRVDIERLLGAWLAAFDAGLGSFEREGASVVIDRLRGRCITIGRTVRVEVPSGGLEGVAVDVDERGRLVVDGRDGRHVVGVGDVVHVRDVRQPHP